MKSLAIILTLAVGAFCTYCPEPNTEYNSCGTSCPQTCEDTGLIACNKMCNAGCFCKKGYMLERKNSTKCVATCKCSEPNMVYSSCNSLCPKRCDDDGSMVCAAVCVPGCGCKPGYILESKTSNKCVATCPEKCPDPNMVYSSCNSPCPKSCDGLDNMLCPAVCIPGCACKPGYMLESKNSNKCVATCPEKCPDPNMVYSSCNSACPKTCDEDDNKVCLAVCVPGCACKEGYMLESKNSTKCVATCPPKKCPKNMQYTDCVGCPQSCTDPEPKMCKMMCMPGCECKKGYIYKDNNFKKCIPKTCCPAQKCTDINKVYTTCGTACPKACDSPPNQACTLQCVTGCFCKPGWLLQSVNSTKCVQSCPLIPNYTNCTDPHKEYKTCGSACPAACDSPKNQACTKQCVAGCFCKTGYLLQSVNSSKCVKSCPLIPNYTNCTDPNKVYTTCGSACPAACDSPKYQVCTEQCVQGCVCKSGFVLENTKSTNCIPIKSCPVVNKCEDPNKEYKDCGTKCPASCDTVGKAIACPAVCQSGCFCKAGLMLESANSTKCVSKCPYKHDY